MEILSRWLHVSAAAVVVGGLVFTRFVLMPAMQNLTAEHRAMLSEHVARHLRPFSMAAIILLVVSGLYNFLLALQGGLDPKYHMIFGVKLLFAAHLLAMVYITASPSRGNTTNSAKRARLLVGGVLSGLIIFALGAYLRTLRG
jgi:uncharacterized membrane protein